MGVKGLPREADLTISAATSAANARLERRKAYAVSATLGLPQPLDCRNRGLASIIVARG
jgi:hypothetical protein